MYIADSTRDVAAARIGGARSVGVASGRSSAGELRDAGADVVLDDLADTATVVAAVDDLTNRPLDEQPAVTDGPAAGAGPVPLPVIARQWPRLGCIGFGGPPAHIALLRKLVVAGPGVAGRRASSRTASRPSTCCRARPPPSSPSTARGGCAARRAH